VAGRVRVVVAADRDVVAARLEAMLRGDPELCVWLGPPGALGRLVEEHDPAVVVLASTAARATATLGALAEATPAPPVVLVVDDPRAAWTPATRRAGVRAVLDRGAGREAIVAAITAVLAGLVTLHPDVVRASPRAARARMDGDEDRALTPRELEILEMLAEGLSNQAIARRLHISRYTVKFHVASLLDKLGAASRTEAVTLGVRRGLIAL
jgi:two-component system, NarL family, response regulator YdfI